MITSSRHGLGGRQCRKEEDDNAKDETLSSGQTNIGIQIPLKEFSWFFGKIWIRV